MILIYMEFVNFVQRRNKKMNLKYYFIVGLVCLYSFLALAESQTPHLHGYGNGSIVIDENDIQVNLTIPGLSVVGFEHRPKTFDQKILIQQAIKHLKQNDVFVFYKKTKWLSRLRHLNVMKVTHNVMFEEEIILNDDDDHSSHDHHHGYSKTESVHTEFKVYMLLKVNEKAPLAEISTSLFELVSELEGLDITVVKNKQHHFKLNPDNITISLNRED